MVLIRLSSIKNEEHVINTLFQPSIKEKIKCMQFN